MAPTLETSFGQQRNVKHTQQDQQQQQQQALATAPMVMSCQAPTPQTRAAVATKTTSANLDDENAHVDPFQMMLKKLETAFSRSNSSVDVDELWRVLEEYTSKNEEWAKYAYYDMNRYKRNLVAEFEKFNVMIICWGPSTRSCIHDHSGSHCFMKVLDGELIESRFAWPDKNTLMGTQTQEMCRLSDTRMELNDVVYINDKVGLHLVENPHQNKTAASLHVYIPPYRKCKAFDQRTGQARECSLAFFSKCGRVIREDEHS